MNGARRPRYGAASSASYILWTALIAGCSPRSADGPPRSATASEESPGDETGSKPRDERGEDTAIQTSRDTESRRDSDLEERVVAYLRCVDFDCSETLSAVVSFGSEAVGPLSALLSEGAPSELESQLPGDVKTMVRLKVLAALGSVQDVAALDPLINALADLNPLIRAEAATALGNFRSDERAASALVPLLKDSDPLVREMTVSALEKLDRAETLPALRDARRTETAEHIQSAIDRAIGRLQGR